MYQVLFKSEGVHPFFVITWPGITHVQGNFYISCKVIAGCTPPLEKFYKWDRTEGWVTAFP